MKRILLFLIFYIYSLINSFGQGIINNYLMGYGGWARAYMDFPNNIPSIQVDSNIALSFRYTHANISDSTGNLLFYTNGVSVVNANHDSMPNGTGLNPCSYTTQAAYYGLSLSQADLILPAPGNWNEYYLIHQSLNNISGGYTNTSLYYSKINMLLNNGMGDVVQKNITIKNDTMWACGTTACKHANGRDWWIIVLQAHNPNYLVFLLTPLGISYKSTQTIGTRWEWGQTAFSQDGEHYGFYNFHDGLNIFDFDRCSGIFSNPRIIQTNDSLWGLGFCFSPNSKLAYAANCHYLNQYNLDSTNLITSCDTVALWDSTYDNFPFETNFEFMQIGPDGKIYMTTASVTHSMHYINYPDSLGVACGMQQHALLLPTKNGNTIPNFVNYFLGPLVGSICDSLGLGVPEFALHDFKFIIQPNPISDNMLSCKYMLPQNTPGILEVIDLTGRILKREPLPEWSTEQHLKLTLAAGVYAVKITSNKQQKVQKMIIQ